MPTDERTIPFPRLAGSRSTAAHIVSQHIDETTRSVVLDLRESQSLAQGFLDEVLQVLDRRVIHASVRGGTERMREHLQASTKYCSNISVRFL